MQMASALLGLLIFFFLLDGAIAANSGFDENYYVVWGQEHVSIDQGGTVQLLMDKSSGSGFGSKLMYGSGFFHFNIMVPGGDSSDVITTFYLSTEKNQSNDEVDIEFLGNKQVQNYTLQTNIYTKGHGGREQRIRLWFDPTTNFHSYKILWNPYQIVFYVDDRPIRVFKNETGQGVGYPSEPMKILATIWESDWATGESNISWASAPFIAQYQDFDVKGSPSSGGRRSSSSDPGRWWNSEKYKSLNATEESLLEDVKRNYLIYDYCADKPRYPQLPPECPQ